jgi:hypothetical protein
MVRNPVVDAQCDKFIESYHNGDKVILPKAQTIFLKLPIGRDRLEALSTVLTPTSLADLLAQAIAIYQQQKGNPNDVIYDIAPHLLDLIERAHACHVIEEVNITNKLRVLEQENEQLKESNLKLKKLNEGLAKENVRLHKLFPDSKKGKTEVGDLST